MSAWPEEKLDVFKDNANYSCVSTHNSVGPGVRSTTFFGVECKYFTFNSEIKFEARNPECSSTLLILIPF